MRHVYLLVLVLLALSWASVAFGPVLPPEPEFDLLLDQVCTMESQGSTRAEYAVNREGSAWGRCQVKYWSAIAYTDFDPHYLATGVPMRSPGDLFDRAVNLATARQILDLCRTLYGHKRTRRVVYCYGAGPNSEAYSNSEHRVWSKMIATHYAERARRLD